MSLSNEQYNTIMMHYSEKRRRHRQDLLQRKAEVYKRIPEYRQLEDSVPANGLASLRKRLGGVSSPEEENAPENITDTISTLSSRKKALLACHGFAEDFLEMTYDCPDCRDTGYTDGRKCHCFRQEEINLLYDQSRLALLIRHNNFGLLSEEYYEGEDLQRFKKAVLLCRKFISDFEKDYNNLYFYGTVGTGKTFLSICTANEILQSGHSVLYFSAADLFDRLGGHAFDYREREEMQNFSADLYSCDLLIIDDLGTELTNTFVASRLFTLINERGLRRKATIISTNLTLEDVQNRYSDRVLSRIVSSYEICKLTGTDIRLRKKTNRKRK